MKITVSYIPEEKEEAAAVLAALRPLLPGVRVHESDRSPPFLHMYLTTRKPKKPRDPKENA